MFKVGDIVKIVLPKYPVYEKSAVNNLEGSIAKIIKVEERHSPFFYCIYKLEFIEMHTKFFDTCIDEYGNYAWKDQHLILINDFDPKVEMKEIDIMDVFGGIYG